MWNVDVLNPRQRIIKIVWSGLLKPEEIKAANVQLDAAVVMSGPIAAMQLDRTRRQSGHEKEFKFSTPEEALAFLAASRRAIRAGARTRAPQARPRP